MSKTEIKGLKELGWALDQMPKRMKRTVLIGALRESARPIHASARNKINEVSGATRKDLKIRVIPKKDTPRELGDAALAIAGSASKGGRAYIMTFLEFGVDRTPERGGYMPPRPFLRPAVDENVGTAIQTFGKEVWKRFRVEIEKLKR